MNKRYYQDNNIINNLKKSKFKILREALLLLNDMFLLAASFAFAFLMTQIYIAGTGEIKDSIIFNLFISMIVIVGLSAFSLWLFGVEKVIWRNARLWDYGKILLAVFVALIIFIFLDQFLFKLIARDNIDVTAKDTLQAFTTYIIYALMGSLVLIITRAGYQILSIKKNKRKANNKKLRTLIIGAGSTGSAILDEIQKGETDYLPVFMLDDDPNKFGRLFNGVEVVGDLSEIEEVCAKCDIQVVIFAIPSMEQPKRGEIIKACNRTKCQVKVIPLMKDMIEGESCFKQIRNVAVSELLGRPQVTFDEKCDMEYVTGKTVIVTGGGGSIGSELCRQLMNYNPARIVVVEIYENCAYSIQQEIKSLGATGVDFCVEILSVTDYDKLEQIFIQYRPDIIFHAAAHKHVPLMETNPEEAVKNNIYGTYNTILLASKYEIERFILISTDKAVNPTNVMGATKRCCEKILQMISRTDTKTKFAAVRFGNVLGSNGSVIPLFKQQIEKGGPVTVTHKDIIRYFMTIPEAVSLVMRAGSYAQNGEIFVLNMGEQVKIVKLAENLITAMGFKPYEDIKIEFTGLRPGEKLYEEVLMDEEGLSKTANDKIFVGNKIQFDDAEFLKDLDEMKTICQTNDKCAIVEKLKVLVPTFNHDKAQFDKMQENTAKIKLKFQSKIDDRKKTNNDVCA